MEKLYWFLKLKTYHQIPRNQRRHPWAHYCNQILGKISLNLPSFLYSLSLRVLKKKINSCTFYRDFTHFWLNFLRFRPCQSVRRKWFAQKSSQILQRKMLWAISFSLSVRTLIVSKLWKITAILLHQHLMEEKIITFVYISQIDF